MASTLTGVVGGRHTAEESNHRHRLLLRAPGEWPPRQNLRRCMSDLHVESIELKVTGARALSTRLGTGRTERAPPKGRRLLNRADGSWRIRVRRADMTARLPACRRDQDVDRN